MTPVEKYRTERDLKKDTDRAKHSSEEAERHRNKRGIILGHVNVDRAAKDSDRAMSRANTSFNKLLKGKIKSTTGK